MKKFIPIIVLLFSLGLNAQNVPNKMNYQLIVRDLSGTIQVNTTLSFRLSIVQGSPSGNVVYQETFTKTTNGFGLINHQLGTGFTMQGNFGAINWSQGPYLVRTEIDFNGGVNYQTVGNTDLISVPYAKYAEVAGSGVNGGVSLDNDSTNELQTLSLQGDTLYLSKSGFVILPQGGSSLDNDTTNELQTITKTGSTVTLSNNGGSITVFDGDYNNLVNTPTIPTQTSQLTNNSGFLTSEIDGSTTNEIQTLSFSNDTLYLTLGGSVYIPTGSSGTSLDNDTTNELQTISKSGSTVTLSNNGGSITVFDGDYNDLTNTPTIPTLTSDLTNDSGFLTSEVDGDNSNELQTISKSGSTITLSDGGGSVTVFDGDYNDLTNTPTIPTLTSDLTNDSGFLTAEVDGDNSNELQTISKSGSTITLSDGGGSVTVFDGDYNGLTNTPTIPTLTSDLTNDSGFLTSEVDGDNSNELQTISKSGSTITLSDGGGSVTVFDGDYNDLTNTPTIPTLTSDLTNDSGFLTAEVDGDNSNELQTISKSGSTITLSDGGGSVTVFDGDYNDLTNTPTIPTLTSDLTNDSGFLTSEVDGDNSNELQTISKSGATITLSDGGGSVTVFDGDYNDLTNTPTIPTLTSDLTNDSGFLTSEVDGDNSNELQTISKSGSTVTLSNNGGSITVFDGDYNDLTNTPTIPTLTSDLTNDSGFLTAEVDGDNSNELQTISKSGSAITLSDGGGSVTVFDGDYNNLTNTPTIPTLTSDLTNDSGFLTAEVDGDNSNELQTISKSGSTITLSDGGGSVTVFDGDYNNLTNQPSIPTLTSDLTNDSGFLTSEVDGDNSNELQTISKSGSTITLSDGGGSVNVFDGDYNNLTNQPTIPTLTSDLTNDSGFLTAEVDGDNSNELQTISKSGSTITLSDGGGSVTVFDGDYTNLTNQPSIPTLTSDLTNDSGFLTAEVDGDNSNELQTISKSGSTVTLSNNGGSITVFDGDYNDLTNTPTIPTLTSDLTNDSGFLTSEVDGDNSNELQTISKSGSTITLSDGGGSVTVFDGDYNNLTNVPTAATQHIDGLKDGYNDSINDNLAFGAYAFDALTSGSNNVAIGNNASKSMTGGSRNVSIGQDALLTNTTGSDNIALGTNSLKSNTTGYDNIALGNGALIQNTTGYYNVALGREALSSNTTGTSNTAMGRFALILNTTGYRNVSIGGESMNQNTTGSLNTAVGAFSLWNNTTANDNTTVGYESMYSNTTGNYNTAIGARALWANTTGTKNFAAGNDALKANTTGSRNVATGFYALKANTTGGENIAVGGYSLAANTTGGSNVAVGDFVLASNTTGGMNVGIGKSALQSNTTASGNVAVGRFALVQNRTGNSNVAIGIETMSQNRTGVANAAVGQSALQFARGSQNTAMGGEALNELRGGDFNVGLGRGSGDNFRNGSKNLFLGAYSSSKDTSITNVVALGHGTQAKQSNRIYIGNSNHSHLYTPAKIVAQGGIQVNDSSSNAPLTINSNSGGIVFPRMTSAERSAISNPVAGTYVYQTDGTSGLYQYNGASWTAVVAGSGTAMVQTLSLSGTTLSLTNGGSVTLSGAEELNDLSDAYRNINDIGIGTGVFASVTSSGQYNVALGSNALNKLTTAHTNTAVGYLAGKSITTGSGNTVIGSFSQTGLTTGGWNVSLGRGSLEQNIVGSSNTAIGSYALEKTKGNSNVGVGSGALSANINGSNNTAIGKNANVTSTNLNNTTAIGYGALASTSNTFQLGNNSITTVSTAGSYEGTGLTATNNSTAGGSAIVEMNSTTKGMLMPRMTQTQRKAIGSPVTGLMVYQTDSTQEGVHFYDGSSWRYLGVGVSSN